MEKLKHHERYTKWIEQTMRNAIEGMRLEKAEKERKKADDEFMASLPSTPIEDFIWAHRDREAE